MEIENKKGIARFCGMVPMVFVVSNLNPLRKWEDKCRIEPTVVENTRAVLLRDFARYGRFCLLFDLFKGLFLIGLCYLSDYA